MPVDDATLPLVTRTRALGRQLRQARAMIAAGEPKAAVARTLRIGRTTLYRHLATAENLDQAG
jgi:DNA invertase Pin-like site-specific DNA recombinase